MLVPYGGLLAADVRPGQTAIVTGATGHFGSAGVAVALAMGAAQVIAPGRNEHMLNTLVRLFIEISLNSAQGSDNFTEICYD